ncbi:hypothetical protein [Chondromyces crocatus]|nr:hypothetical protein [Chondromyces crocatus]
MDAITAWAVSIMVSWAPPGRSHIRDAVETPEEGRARYEAIAEAAARVAYDPELDPVFRGPRGRATTMALLLSIAKHESGFRRDVDLGKGPLSRGSGTDSCLLQIRVGKGKTAEGWTHEDLVEDREKCFRSGHALIKRSFGACRNLPMLDWLGAYTRGRCVQGEPASQSRMKLAQRAPQAPLDDAAALAARAKATPHP